MTLIEIWTSAIEAANLLAAYPLRWFAVVIVFLVVAEGVMFIPYVGFTLKLFLATVLGAQALVLFADASAGQTPQITKLFDAFSLPASAQLALFAAALVSFLVGLLYLFAKGGTPAIAFFFGNILKLKPPEPQLFLQFKVVMHLAVLPFTFLGGAVVLKGLSGWAAISTALSVAISNGWVLVVLLVFTLCFEGLMAVIPVMLSKAVGAPVVGVLLVVYVAWSFAFVYTLSARAYKDFPTTEIDRASRS
jgi:hypothetical protein